jgi:O-antigen ligase
MVEVGARSAVHNVLKSMTTPKFLAVSTALFLGLFFLVSSDRLHRNIYYLFVLVPFLFVLCRRPIIAVVKARTLIFILLLFSFLLCSLLWSEGVDDEVVFNVLRKEIITVCFVLVVAWLWQQGYKNYLLVGLMLGAFLGAWLSIYNFYFFDGNLWTTRLEGIGRGEHAIKSPVMYGAVLITLFGVMSQQLPVTRNIKLWAYCAMVSYLIFIVLSQTRGVLISISGAFLLVLVLRRQYKQIAALTVLAGLVVLYAYSEGIFERMHTLHDVRWDIWAQSLTIWSERPVLGYGIYPEQVIVLASGQSFPHPHNIFLSHLLYGGVVGLLLLLCLMASLLYSSLKLWREESNILPLGLCVYFLLVGLFDFSTLIRSADVEWVFCWWLVAIVIASEGKETTTRNALV